MGLWEIDFDIFFLNSGKHVKFTQKFEVVNIFEFILSFLLKTHALFENYSHFHYPFITALGKKKL